MFRNNYVDKRRKSPSEATRRKISETLTGSKIGGQESFIDVKASEELRRRVSDGGNFKYQQIIDWWLDLKE